jgi:hypothetical protein
MIEKQSRIPKISDEKIAELSGRIRPVVRLARTTVHTSGGNGSTLFVWAELDRNGTLSPDKRGMLHYIKPVDPRSIAFPWEPVSDGVATGIEPVAEITTYHTFGYQGLFKPSIAEVLAQLPAELPDDIVAFEVIGPESTSDLNKHIEELNEGFHVAETILYRRM